MVYIDKYPDNWDVGYLCRKWYYLWADDKKELNIFAKKIGLKRAWFQEHRDKHYFVSETKRDLALANGAIEVDRKAAGEPREGK